MLLRVVQERFLRRHGSVAAGALHQLIQVLALSVQVLLRLFKVKLVTERVQPARPTSEGEELVVSKH
jgi:hypothetical protein